MRHLLTIIFTFCLFIHLHAQDYMYKLGFSSITDNREYFNDIQVPQTIFGVQSHGSLGMLLDSTHYFNLGITYMYEYGAKIDNIPPMPTIYYHGKNKWLDIYAGAFPRENLLNYPHALIKDTIDYYRPNIEGLYGKIHNKWGYENIWIDWTSRQSLDDNEAFLFGASGRMQWKWLYLEHYFYMHHHAGKAIDPDHHIRDNGGGLGRVGIELSDYLPLDSALISAGPTVFLDQLRGSYNLEPHHGIIAKTTLTYNIFGLEAIHFQGDGHEVVYGDRFYQADKYTRLNFFFFPIFSEKITGRFMFSLHFIQGSIDHSESLLINMSLSETFGKK